MSRLWMVLSTLAILAVSAEAQRSVLPSRPAPEPEQPFDFPTVKPHTLTNGLRVVIVEDHSVPVVAVRAVLGVDQLLDPPGKEGVYQVMLGALREGTTTRSAAQIAEASARIGTAIAPTAFTTTPDAFQASLALMGDMIMHPSFDDSAITRRRAAQAATARTAAQRPSTPATNLFYSILHGRDDPYVRSLYVSEATVAALSRQDVMDFYEKYVGPQRATIIIVGDVTEPRALAAARAVFGTWRKSAVGLTATAAAPAPAPRQTTIYLHDVPGTAAYLYVGNIGPQRAAPDAFGAELMGAIASARFVQTLREKRSLIYSGSTGMIWRPMPRRAEFLGSTNVAAPKADSALTEWLGMLRGMRGASLPAAEELENARRARVGPLFVRIDGPDSIATRLTEIVRDNLPLDYLERYAAGMGAVRTADVEAAAARYIDVDHLVIVVTGDRKVLEPALRAANLAPIVVVDANGKPIS